VATAKHDCKSKLRFGKKKRRIIVRELFSSDLEEKMTSAGYKRSKKHFAIQAVIYSKTWRVGFAHAKLKYS